MIGEENVAGSLVSRLCAASRGAVMLLRGARRRRWPCCSQGSWMAQQRQRFGNGMVRGGAAAVPPQVCGCGYGPGVPSRERIAWGSGSGRKSLPAFLLAQMTVAPLGVVFPVGGVILKLPLVCTGALGENPVQILDERRRSLGVVTSLEALSLETHLG